MCLCVHKDLDTSVTLLLGTLSRSYTILKAFRNYTICDKSLIRLPILFFSHTKYKIDIHILLPWKAKQTRSNYFRNHHEVFEIDRTTLAYINYPSVKEGRIDGPALTVENLVFEKLNLNNSIHFPHINSMSYVFINIILMPFLVLKLLYTLFLTHKTCSINKKLSFSSFLCF